MSDDVKPALTAEEWRTIDLQDRGKMVGPKVRGSVVRSLPSHHVHAAAALALHGQSFGFTRDDVRLLRDSQLWADSTQLTSGGNPVDFDDLANRIAALLPPEDA